MTVSRIVTAVKLPAAAHAEPALLIPDMRQLARGARELVDQAVRSADTSGKMLKASDYVAEVRGQVGRAATLVQVIEAHATSMYGPAAGARQAGDAVFALANIEHDLASTVTRRSFLGFGDTRTMGLDSVMQARIHAASDKVGELQAWTEHLAPRPLLPARLPVTSALEPAFSHVPAGHAAAPAPHGVAAPPAAFSSPDAQQVAVLAPTGMKAPRPGFSSPPAIGTPVKAQGSAGQAPVAFSSAEQLDAPVKARKPGKAAQLRFSDVVTPDVPRTLAPGSAGYGRMLFLG